MNYLGIDYGEKRIGLARASEDIEIAIPFSTIENNEKAIQEISRIINVENIDVVVIGIPVSFDGTENSFARSIRNFGERLEILTGKRIEFENEIFTSKIASENSEGENIDKSSAAIILQSFLSRSKA